MKNEHEDWKAGPRVEELGYEKNRKYSQSFGSESVCSLSMTTSRIEMARKMATAPKGEIFHVSNFIHSQRFRVSSLPPSLPPSLSLSLSLSHLPFAVFSLMPLHARKCAREEEKCTCRYGRKHLLFRGTGSWSNNRGPGYEEIEWRLYNQPEWENNIDEVALHSRRNLRVSVAGN